MNPSQYFFSYPATFLNLTAGTSQQYQLTTDSDSLFEIFTTQASVFTPDTVPDLVDGSHYAGLNCRIYDTQTGQYLTNGKTPIVNIFGTSQYPNIWPITHYLLRRSVLEITLYNDSATDRARVQLVFSGIKHIVGGTT